MRFKTYYENVFQPASERELAERLVHQYEEDIDNIWEYYETPYLAWGDKLGELLDEYFPTGYYKSFNLIPLAKKLMPKLKSTGIVGQWFGTLGGYNIMIYQRDTGFLSMAGGVIYTNKIFSPEFVRLHLLSGLNENVFKPTTDQERGERKEEYKAMAFEEWMESHQDMLIDNGDGTYNSNVDISLPYMGLTELPIKFKKVFGSFDIAGNLLKTLEGSPEYVGGGFFASHNKLESMVGGPDRVNGSFLINDNYLTSLEGSPTDINGSYNISANPGPDGRGFSEEAIEAVCDTTRDWGESRSVSVGPRE